MDKTLYLECYSGISGDMAVAALLDLGADEETLMDVLDSLPVQGFKIKISRVKKSGIDACDFNVILDEEHDGHDHDMEYLYGHEHPHEGGHEAADHVSGQHEAVDSGHRQHEAADAESGHSHGLHGHDDHHHDDHHHGHHHMHRGMKEIREIIEKAKMTDNARAIALRIFQVIAEAESKAHNLPVEEVHFHEVGAVDSIVDVISVAVCMDNLGIRNVIVPKLYEGRGTVRCQHGILPVPVPAVANIVQANGIRLEITSVDGELVTPTGAAIIAATRTTDRLPKDFLIEKIGLGAGKREYERPGILRAMLIRDSAQEQDGIYKLESNIDDCSGEALGYVMERLFEAGARDVHYIPVFMKKNRPAWLLTVICGEADVEKMERIIFEETTTIGIRRVRMERTVLKRQREKVNTSFGEADVKVCEIDGRKRFYPEYESIRRICRESGKSYGDVYQMIVEACQVDDMLGML